MNLNRCIYGAASVGHVFFKNCNIVDGNVKSFQRSNLKVLITSVLLNSRSTHSAASTLIKETLTLPKKRLSKKKKQLVDLEKSNFLLKAFCTAEEYNLEKLPLALHESTAFKVTTFGSDYGNSVDVVHAKRNSETNLASEDLFFFRKGCVIMWNIPELDEKNIINFLKSYEDNGFLDDIIQNESEILTYSVSDNGVEAKILNDSIVLSSDDNVLEKYAISNAMALSVQLGTYEANLEKYIDTMEPVTEDLKAGNRIKMSRSEVLQKTGQLFALRHNINLNNDLLDTPDFYWDREELENLYQITFNYYCINKRTKVINEKINHCIELVDLLSSHLNDKHHIRLEWMIIILIMVEVAFEIFHCIEYLVLTNK